MLHIIYGTDRAKAQKRYRELIDAAHAKDSGLEIRELRADTFVRSELEELVQAQSLFGSATLVFADGICEREEAKRSLLEIAEALANSVNTFVLLEEELLADDLRRLQPHTTLEECKKVAMGREDEKPLYAIEDALAQKNKKELWVSYQRALLLGFPEEKIFWKLTRFLKNMLLVKCGGTIDDLGTKSDFVFKKTASAAKNFTEKELAKRHSELVTIFHDSHRGLADFDLALERWLLSI